MVDPLTRKVAPRSRRWPLHPRPKESAPASACAPRSGRRLKARQAHHVPIGLARPDAVYSSHAPLRFGAQTNLQSNQNSDENPVVAKPRFTATQGQYLAFIGAYTSVNGRPPGRG